MAEDLYSFGSWVRLRRQALVLSREELARRVGVAEVSIRKIEADERRPSPQVAALLAQHLQLAPETHAVFVQVARGVLPVEQLPPPIPGATLAPAPASTETSPAQLPVGTLTFLFTDIEGSTQLWEQHPDAMPSALARHDAILRQTITAHTGVVFKMVGDAVYAAFARASDALAAALAAQGALQAEPWALGPLRVRMALHSGVAEVRDGDYFGLPLSRIARLLGAGHGGQVLLSHVTQQLVCEHLPDGVEVIDLGKHQLKDLTQPEQIFQLAAPDLHADFPPLRTLDRRRTNLPAQPTPLIGRERETAETVALLRRADARLVTLSGPGGTGKTRLGLQVAAELLEDFADGVYFVDLAPIRDGALVVSTIAQTFALNEIARQPPLDQLKTYLREKQLLLVLDNFEQVIDAAPLVAELLAGCPRLKVLVTSRVVLHLRGEKEVEVPPLALPDLHRLPPSGQLSQYAAVELFIQRALDVQPAFAVTNENAPAVAEICARLDGLPLAIELAARRIKLFAPEALLARLSDRLTLLTGGARDLPQRQQTLRDAIAWSYDLLEADAQTLFARLAVFVGGCTMEAAEVVCNADGNLSLEVLDGLARLLDNSLLRHADSAESESRFTMMETIREYALERLGARGEAMALRRRHAKYFLALAEAAQPQLHGVEWRIWLDRLEVEHDNLRAALAWALDGEDAEIGCRLAVALTEFWTARGYWNEGRRWREAALAQSGGVASTIRAMVLLRAAEYTWQHEEGDWQQAWARVDEALALFRAAGDRAGIAAALTAIGTSTQILGDDAHTVQRFEMALALYRELGDQHGIANTLHHLGDIVRDQGDIARGTALLEESLAIFRKLGDVVEAGLVLNGLGDVACRQGDYSRALALYWESVPLIQPTGDRGSLLWPLRNLGWMALIQGDDGRVRALLQEYVDWSRDKAALTGLAYAIHVLGAVVNAQGDTAQATALLREGLMLQQRPGWEPDESLQAFAGVAAGQGQPIRAARLLGAIANMPRGSAVQAAYDHLVTLVRAQLDEAAFAAAWAEGRALSLEQAIAEAQSLIRKPAAPIRKPDLPDEASHLISDAQWERIAPLLPPTSEQQTGRPRMDDRQAMSAIFYALESGCGWRALPRTLGAPSTIYDRFKAWRAAGVFDRLWRAGLLTEAMARRVGLEEAH